MIDPNLEAALSRLPWALLLNAALAAAAYSVRTVRIGGALAGTLLGTCVLGFAGWGPFALLAVFFVLGSTLTRWGWTTKERRGVAEGHRGARGALQVLANGAPAAALSVLYSATGGAPALMVALAGSLAAASADTASSELGQVYGRRPLSLAGLKRVPVGTPGAISSAGTVAGALAGLLIGVVATAAGVISLKAIPVVAVSAILAATCESTLAAATGGSAGHHVLNLINSCVGALCAMAFWVLLY